MVCGSSKVALSWLLGFGAQNRDLWEFVFLNGKFRVECIFFCYVNDRGIYTRTFMYNIYQNNVCLQI